MSGCESYHILANADAHVMDSLTKSAIKNNNLNSRLDRSEWMKQILTNCNCNLKVCKF